MLCSAFGRLSTPVVPWILWWGSEHEGSYAVRQTTLTIHHLYADMMNLYGDRGNVISIKKRCEWRGIPVEVVEVGLGEGIKPTGCDLFLFGGGQDREQSLLVDDLAGKKGADLRAIAEDGGVVLGVCGGYQMMGHYYETPEGEKLSGLGVFDLHWQASPGRLTVSSERIGDGDWHTVQQDVLLVLDPRSLHEPHAERLLGDELVSRAQIDPLEERTHLRGAERGAFAAERAARVAASG
jgi:hypothetical protein